MLKKSRKNARAFGLAMAEARKDVGDLVDFNITIPMVAAATGLGLGQYRKLERGQEPDQWVLDRLTEFYEGQPAIVQELKKAYSAEFETPERAQSYIALASNRKPQRVKAAIEKATAKAREFFFDGDAVRAVQNMSSAWSLEKACRTDDRQFYTLSVLYSWYLSESGDDKLAMKVLREAKSLLGEFMTPIGDSEFEFYRWMYIQQLWKKPSIEILDGAQLIETSSPNMYGFSYEGKGKRLGKVIVVERIHHLCDILLNERSEKLTEMRKVLERITAEGGDEDMGLNVEFARVRMQASLDDPRMALRSLRRFERTDLSFLWKARLGRSFIVAMYRSNYEGGARADAYYLMRECGARNFKNQQFLCYNLAQQIEASLPSDATMAERPRLNFADFEDELEYYAAITRAAGLSD